jgi:hypothetical protein
MLNACHIIHSVTVTILSTALRRLLLRLTWCLVLGKTSLPITFIIFFILIFISFSSSPSLHHSLPHQFTFSIMTTYNIIELQPTSMFLSFTLRFPCGVSIVIRWHGEHKKGRVSRSFWLHQYAKFGVEISCKYFISTLRTLADHRAVLDVSFNHITAKCELLHNQQEVLSQSRSHFIPVCLGVEPHYQLKTTYFPFVSASFVIRGRLHWRDVGSVLVESKSLYLFKWVGNVFSRCYSLKNVRKPKLQENTFSILWQRVPPHDTSSIWNWKKMTDDVLLITAMSPVIALRNYSRLIT